MITVQSIAQFEPCMKINQLEALIKPRRSQPTVWRREVKPATQKNAAAETACAQTAQISLCRISRLKESWETNAWIKPSFQ